MPENSERGAYGYFDRHPIATRRDSSVSDYLYDRVLGIHQLVPGARETHIRVDLIEKWSAAAYLASWRSDGPKRTIRIYELRT